MTAITTTTAVDVTVVCSECGIGLNEYQAEEDRNGDWTIKVDPCETCLQQAENKGYDEGAEAQ